MEQTLPPMSGIIRRPPSMTQPAASQEPEIPAKPYFKRIFMGRLNRQNYSVGSILLLGVPLLCFIVVFGSFLSTSGVLSWLLINPYDANQMHSATIQAENIEKSLMDLQASPINRIILIVLGIYVIITLPINLGLQVRRLHDMNNSGWLILLNLIPFVGYFFPFYTTFFPGTNGDNKYGPKPLQRTNIKKDTFMLRTRENPKQMPA